MEQDVQTLHDALAVVRRRWRLLLACVVLGVLVAVGLAALETPKYTASADLLVLTRTQLSDTGRPIDPVQVATQADVVVSDAVASRVVSELGLDTSSTNLLKNVTATPAADKAVVTITATGESAQSAADIANGFADGYLKLIGLRASAEQTAISESYLNRLSDTRSQLAAVRKQLKTAGPTRRQDLKAEVESLLSRQAELQSSLRLADDPTAFISGGSVLHRADPPKQASEPRPLRAGLLGAVIGLVLGLALIFIRDRRDDKIRAGRAPAGALADLPVLARIPSEPSSVRGRVASLQEPRSPVAEAYRGLNTNVRFLLAAGGPNASDAAVSVPLGRIVMVSSASPAEGKTSVAANLAVAAARVGMRVILVDGDLRNPALHRYFGIEARRGLADLLRESGPLSEHLLEVGVENLSVLPAGSTPPNPTDLLASTRCARLWQDLRQVADLIIVDTPPLTRVVDGMEVAGNADVIVLVARDRVSHEHQVQSARVRLGQVGARASGIVVNAVPTKWSSFDYDYDAASQQSQTV